MRRTMKTIWPVTVSAVAIVIAAGCTSRQPEGYNHFGNLTDRIKREFEERKQPPPLAGTKREAIPHTNEEIVASADLTFLNRRNPFALHGAEYAFENQIRWGIIESKMVPTYTVGFPAPTAITPPEAIPIEPQPYRRVAGVYFGESVRAIVIMEDGRAVHVVPGDRIGEWTVKSIGPEEIVLTRQNRLPSEVRIRLEAAPPGMPGSGGGGGAPGGGGGGGGTTQPGSGGGGGRAGTPGID